MKQADVISMAVILWQTLMIVQALFITENVTAEKGQDVLLVCDLGLAPGNWNRVDVYQSSTMDFRLSQTYSAVCGKDKCQQHPRNYVETDGFDVCINISNLNRSEDQMYWTCIHEHTISQMFLTVYTTPTASLLTSSFDDLYSLSEGSAILTCQTDNCAYKDPEFIWYIVFQNGTRQPFDHGETTTWNLTSSCNDSEMIYYNELSIQENTTFPDNSDITVQFVCAISFPTLKNELVSPPSGYVTFALQVDLVELLDGDKVTTDNGTVTVADNEQYTVTCKPGPSRPRQIFLFYIGTKKLTESDNGTFTFTPGRGHHGDKIYCKAYNLQGIGNAIVSNKPTIFVNIPVSEVLLRDGNDQLENCSIISVSEGVFQTLSCTPDESRPTPTIVWYIGEIIRQNHTSNIFTFIPGMDDHNKGVYCVAYNLPGYDRVESYKPTLQVFGKPLPPSTFLFTGLRGQNATFYWIAGYDGGYEQYFVLQYKHITVNDWINHTQFVKVTHQNAGASLNAYAAQINDLVAGVYSARLIGRNVHGESIPMDIIGSTFEITDPVCESTVSEVCQSSSPVITTASVMGCVILILFGIVTYLLLLLKRSRRKSVTKTEIKLEDIPAPSIETQSTVYDEPTTTEQAREAAYDELQKTETRMYENTTVTED